MKIAIIGERAAELRGYLEGGVEAFPAVRAVTDASWDLLALTQDALSAAFPVTLRSATLLLPGSGGAALARAVHPFQTVGYGFSPRDTLTLSSVQSGEGLVCLQRSLLALDGTLIEPQETPLPHAFAALPAEHALLLAGIRLLAGAREG